MTDAEWPAPEPATPREPERRTTPLPRVEDLPIAEQGYDREKVREAFDAFYRHAAQLDATLGTLEAVEVFQRTSAELRAELRNIRGSGWTVQSWQGGTGYAGGGSRGRVSEWTLPPSFPRLALEFGFLIAIGVVVGVAGAALLTRAMATLLFGVTPTDLVTFVSVPLVLAAAGLLATYVPAIRATRVDPVVALRDE